MREISDGQLAEVGSIMRNPEVQMRKGNGALLAEPSHEWPRRSVGSEVTG